MFRAYRTTTVGVGNTHSECARSIAACVINPIAILLVFFSMTLLRHWKIDGHRLSKDQNRVEECDCKNENRFGNSKRHYMPHRLSHTALITCGVPVFISSTSFLAISREFIPSRCQFCFWTTADRQLLVPNRERDVAACRLD